MLLFINRKAYVFQGDFTGVDPDLCWPESSVELIEEVPQTLNAMYI